MMGESADAELMLNGCAIVAELLVGAGSLSLEGIGNYIPALRPPLGCREQLRSAEPTSRDGSKQHFRADPHRAELGEPSLRKGRA